MTKAPAHKLNQTRSGKDQGARRDSVINVRLPTATRALIDGAASAMGKTRTEFVLESARQRATEILLDQALFSLDEQNYAAFLQALDHPPEPTAKLRALLNAKAPWEV